MPKKWETRCAWVALGLGGLLAVAADALPIPRLSWFWCLAFGFAGFFGFGVWSVWLDPREQGVKRDRTWVFYQYGLNAFGCLVGWLAFRLLLSRFTGAEHITPTDFALAAVAFIGMVGWLPGAVLGFTQGLADLAKKVLGA